ncbi:kxDL motif-containing protein CG10681 [Cylas formicarius]|uniref:kxDL motif-containing protein CG10681 n=1 Tax=Cylas formicarius TaxID=197179 RepID=UPI0029583DA1|nr:kxDL motif-containing protein CG10681 [Cylas formicarius]
MDETKGTPESEFSIECFQNYSAPEVFIQGLAGIVDQQDVESMIRAQKEMLQRFEKTNEMLTNCNVLSANRLKTVGPEFKRHIHLLLDMKKDLDYISKKIRAIRTKISAQYPEAFIKALENDITESEKEECVEESKKSNDNRRSLHIKGDSAENTDLSRRASK